MHKSFQQKIIQLYLQYFLQRYNILNIFYCWSKKELQIFSIRHNTKNLHEFYFLCRDLLFTIIIWLLVEDCCLSSNVSLLISH